MNRNELIKDVAKCAPELFQAMEDAVEDDSNRLHEAIKQKFASLIEFVVLDTCSRIAREHLLTEPSRN